MRRYTVICLAWLVFLAAFAQFLIWYDEELKALEDCQFATKVVEEMEPNASRLRLEEEIWHNCSH